MCVLIINHVTWNLCKCSVSGKHFRLQLLRSAFFNILLLQATGGGYNPKCLGCYYTCAVFCMWPMFVCTSSKNEWSVENVIRLCAFQPSTSCNVIMHVLTICEWNLCKADKWSKSICTSDCCHLQSCSLNLCLFLVTSLLLPLNFTFAGASIICLIIKIKNIEVFSVKFVASF